VTPDWLRIGAELTASGLSLVFLVLALLWAVIVLLVRLDRGTMPAAAAMQPAEAPAELDPERLAAVMIAVRAHLRATRAHPKPHRPGGGSRSQWASTGRERQTHHWPPPR
jgi:Na+-transporting methylmalonyl-CoA/oxaloacetate decarboxylase gamma subunit